MCDCMFLGCLGACAAAIFIAGFYFFFGVIFMTLASRAKASVSLYEDLLSYDVSLFPNLCIIIGFLFTLLTLLGFLGEKKGRSTRIFYAIAQTLVVILGLYIYIDAYPNEVQLEKHLFQGLNSSIHNYGLDAVDDSQSVTLKWDNLQENLQCCGVKNYLDWENIRPYGPSSPPTPISCCKDEHRMNGCSIHVRFDHPAESKAIIYVKGCLEEVRSELLGRMGILHYFLIPILIITAIGCVLTCCSSGVKKDTEMTEKKMGILVIRTRKTRKSALTSYDVEAAEKSNQDQENEEDITQDVEMEQLNPKKQNAAETK